MQKDDRYYSTVLLPLAVDRLFTYAMNNSLKPGTVVSVSFRNKMTHGIVWGNEIATDFDGPVKEIVQIHQVLPAVSLQFIDWVARYTMTAKGLIAKMVLTGFDEKSIASENPIFDHHFKVDLSIEQQQAADTILKACQIQEFSPFLLEGITGSGKTEVYFQAIAAALKLNKQILLLLPEIALTNQLIERFEQCFGSKPFIWHSGMTPKARKTVWQNVLSGQSCVVVGARSALFLPFPNLGLIIVDEEHDVSYKQEEQVRYHARDMAVVRAQLSQIPIVLATATPSLETLTNVKQGRYQHLCLTARHGGAVLPEIHVIDMRKQSSEWIALPLQQALSEVINNSQQAMLFLNRRGYAPLTLCRSCGHRLMCPGCTAWLVEHKKSQRLHCHHCGYTQGLPETCPACQTKESWVACGPGVERIYEAVTQLFPQARLALLTSDTLSTPKQIKELFERIQQRDIDILIGTQVLAKGHHFPMMTLIGVIDGDLGLSGGDLRASERTFQLLHQVAGRAGRAHLKGHVYLQTYQPQHPVIQALSQANMAQFLSEELAAREAAQMPPFGRLAGVIVSGLNAQDVEITARMLAQKAPRHNELILLGPVPAPLAQLRGRHRWRLLLKASRAINLQAYLKDWLAQVKSRGNTHIAVDIDPYSFL